MATRKIFTPTAFSLQLQQQTTATRKFTMDSDSFLNNKEGFELIRQAELHYRNGLRAHGLLQLEEAIQEFKQCCKLREATIGRYSSKTGDVYRSLGNSYYHKKEFKNSVIAYRTCCKIRQTEGNEFYSENFEAILSAYYKSPAEIQCYMSNLAKSIQNEMEGDNLREQGQFQKAIDKYVKAIELEDACIGNDITLPFLWRKIACIQDQGRDGTKNHVLKMNWKQMDLIYTKRTEEKPCGFPLDVFHEIREGDVQYCHGNYKEALRWYEKATQELSQLHSNIGAASYTGQCYYPECRIVQQVVQNQTHELMQSFEEKLENMKHELIKHFCLEDWSDAMGDKMIERIDDKLTRMEQAILERIEVTETRTIAQLCCLRKGLLFHKKLHPAMSENDNNNDAIQQTGDVDDMNTTDHHNSNQMELKNCSVKLPSNQQITHAMKEETKNCTNHDKQVKDILQTINTILSLDVKVNNKDDERLETIADSTTLATTGQTTQECDPEAMKNSSNMKQSDMDKCSNIQLCVPIPNTCPDKGERNHSVESNYDTNSDHTET